MTHEANPWKATVLAIALGVPLVAVGTIVANLTDRGRASSSGAAPAASSRAPAAVVEECNRFAAEAERDATRVLRDGVLGGAGVGALVGATAGTPLYGLNEEDRKSEQAMGAYRDCMDRRGY